MTIATVKSVVAKFLASPLPEVLVLKGAWGVGKTFAWKRLVLEHKSQIKKKGYCYVSLFGISSIADLRTAIFTKTQSVSLLGQPIDAKTINDRWVDLLMQGGRQAFRASANVIRGLPYGQNVTVGIETIAPYLIRDSLICFDDFERMASDKIKPNELLGFISELKEEKNCKVVLIFNEDHLESIDIYKKYREKVVDIELLYLPTPEEATNLALPDNIPCRELIKKYSMSLGITNIRVLRKIVSLTELIYSQVSSLHPRVMEQAVMTMVLLAWCYYEHGGNKPTFEFIVEWNKLAWGIKKAAGEEQSAQHAAWSKILQDYGLLHMDEFDQTLGRVVTCGYLEGTGFSEEAVKLDGLNKAGELEQSFSAAWNMFHNTFGDNKEQLVTALSDSFRKSVRHISPLNLNGTTRLLRQLGEEQLADELIDFYVVNRAGEDKLFDLSDTPFSGDINDPAILKRFEEKFAESHADLTLTDAVSFIVNNSGWSKQHIDALAKASVDDFYEFFKRDHGNQLSGVVKACLQFEGFNDHKSIGEKAREALVRIGRENELNAIRVLRYGVKQPPRAEPVA